MRFPEKFPEDDTALADFLRQHRQAVPPESPDLEDRIMEMVVASQRSLKVVPLRRPNWKLRLLGTGAIAASLIGGLLSYRLLPPSPLSYAELSRLEAYMETNWNSAIGETQAEDVIVMVN